MACFFLYHTKHYEWSDDDTISLDVFDAFDVIETAAPSYLFLFLSRLLLQDGGGVTLLCVVVFLQ